MRIAAFHKIEGIAELWVESGKGKSLKCLPVHEISQGLGVLKSRAISGCGTASSVVGKGKKSFYETWSLIPEATDTFFKLGEVADVSDIADGDFTMLEKFLVVMYCPTLNTDEINMARRMMFIQGGRSLENIPPTAGALKQHV